MDAQQFLAEFGHIANAPGGITRLRELVFGLASEGMLLEENEAIDAIHLDKVAEFVMGQAPPGVECNSLGEGTVFVKTGEFGELYPIVREWTTKPLKLAKEGDVLICVVGATVGKLNLAIDCAIGRSVAAIRPLGGVLTKYLYYMLMPFTLRLRSGSRGSAQGVIGKKELSSITLRVPSEEEQSRIVAKVDELMALCDQLEALQQKRRTLQNHLRQATLQAVAASQSPHELQESWQRLQANFGQRFSAPEDVADLRNLILDVAMHGYIVEQDAQEGSAQELLQQIESIKEHESKKRKIKLQKSLPDIGADEIPFNIPRNWEWIRLGKIVELINGDRGKNYPNKDEYVSKGIAWINTGHIEPNGTLTKTGMNYITKEKFESLRSGKIEPDDLVYCLRGATFGKTAFVTPYEEGAIASSLMIIRPLSKLLNKYFYYYLISPLGRSQIFRFDNGTAQPNLSANSVGMFAYPLPPLAEQVRIVEKIEQLMQVCDELELKLKRAKEVAEQLATASISALTGIAIEQEEEPMKAPQTELVAPVHLGTPPDVKAQSPLATILARHNGEMSAKDLWQRFGGEIDAFYAQLKTEVAHGWLLEPAPAEMREKAAS